MPRCEDTAIFTGRKLKEVIFKTLAGTLCAIFSVSTTSADRCVVMGFGVRAVDSGRARNFHLGAIALRGSGGLPSRRSWSGLQTSFADFDLQKRSKFENFAQCI